MSYFYRQDTYFSNIQNTLFIKHAVSITHGNPQAEQKSESQKINKP